MCGSWSRQPRGGNPSSWAPPGEPRNRSRTWGACPARLVQDGMNGARVEIDDVIRGRLVADVRHIVHVVRSEENQGARRGMLFLAIDRHIQLSVTEQEDLLPRMVVGRMRGHSRPEGRDVHLELLKCRGGRIKNRPVQADRGDPDRKSVV